MRYSARAEFGDLPRTTAAVVALSLAATSAGVQALESRLVASGLSQPLFLTAPAGDSRLFIVEKAGRIKIQHNGVVQATPFLDISALVSSGNDERGLLGLAFDPNFAQPGQPGYQTFYVNYIDRTSLNTVVASYTVSANEPNRADTATANVLLTVLQPSGLSNHKAGWIGFRPGEPNNLYIATGDGGSSNDPNGRAQSPNDNLGKMLRIDVRGDAFPGDAVRDYLIPAGNPFGRDSQGNDIPGNDEIWAYGLRNPYRNSFDRVTGDFYIADVGQDAREEINFERASFAGGANYGWRAREGKFDNPNVGDAAAGNAVDPVYDYAHGVTGRNPRFLPFEGNSVTGGYVYRGPLAELQGQYIFGDYVSERIWSLRVDPVTGTLVTGSLRDLTATFANAAGINRISSFGEDGFGNLYAVDIGGQIFALVPEPSSWAMLLAGALALLPLARRRDPARSGR
jgi:hypothetical protein